MRSTGFPAFVPCIGRQSGMKKRYGALACVLTFAILAVLSKDSVALSRNQHVQRTHRGDMPMAAGKQRAVARLKTKRATHVAVVRRKPAPAVAASAPIATASPQPDDLAALKN